MPRRQVPFQPSAVRRSLLGWFGSHARRLPWRKTRSPYAIWVSEVMLQQTQVATVIPYYTRFLHAFPDVRSLARAPLERVLELWSGLGYYRRARHLHQAAQLIVRKFQGRFPRQYRDGRALPGIGEYTAHAVLSIAFNQPYAVLDGNVARVVARLRARRGNLHQRSFRQAVESDLERLLSPRRPGDFNQAMMELGQTVCLPRAPRCRICPLKKWCRASELGKAESYPAPRPRRATELRYLAVAVIRRGSRVALVRGLDEGLMSGLWNFPSGFGATRQAAFANLAEKLHSLAPGWIEVGRTIGRLRHGITFRTIRAEVYSATVSDPLTGRSWRWVDLADFPRAAVSQLARKIAAILPQVS
ncbi:MAG: A/G-specific adenine glycosylase [Acidobacteriia bacterium]|nr:A/G-specific adenine glycosylase [Terriglobia bacterium]